MPNKKQSSFINSANSNKLNLLSIIIIQFTSILFIYFVKYQKHGLTLYNFSLLKTGNLLNLLFFILFLIGIILLFIKRSKIFEKRVKIFYIISFLQLFFLLSAFISLEVNINSKDFYLLEQPIQKVLTGLLFSIFQFSQVYLINIFWQLVFEREQLLYIRTFFNTNIALILLIALSLYFSQLNSSDISYYKNSTNNFNIGVVLGAAVWSGNIPSPSLAARADKAVQLYKEGKIKKIQFTGSNAPGEKAESIVAFEYIRKDSIPSIDILIESNTTSTVEQIQFIKNEIIDISKKTDILVISDGYHLRRVNEIAKFYGLDIKVVASDLKISWQNIFYSRIRESIALLFFWLYAI